MDIIDTLSVDVERNDNLKKAKLENGFYDMVDGGKVSSSKGLSVINPGTENNKSENLLDVKLQFRQQQRQLAQKRQSPL